MSLHDMYFSKKNKNHIFSIIQDLVLDETGSDINQNMDYIDLYRIKYSLIFERVNTDNLVDLNKALIDEIAPLFINDIESRYKENQIEIIHEPIERQKDIYEDKSKEIFIHSSDRLPDSLNRYNYSVQLRDSINEISIKEITVPEENNILFTNPLLCIVVTIGTNKFNNYCKLTNKTKLNDHQYNVYTPTKNLKIICKNINKITINILNNNLLPVDDKSDKINIQKMKKINYQNINYLGIEIQGVHELKEKYSIGIYKNDKLYRAYMIDKVIGHHLLIQNDNFNYNKGETYYLLNMNLQNNILLNTL